MLPFKRVVFFSIISMFSLSGTCAEIPSREEMFSRLSDLVATGSPEVKYNLGMFLNNGIGTPRDNKAAFRFFSEAAEAGNELASYKVGCYLAGQFPGVVPVNEQEAVKYKLRAAEAGYDIAQYDVGMHFWKKRDIENALLWWERASRQGNLEATAYLANYLTSDASLDEAKGYGLMLIFKDMMKNPGSQFLQHVSIIERKLTSEQKSKAASVHDSWLTGKSALTLKAQAGIDSVPALIRSIGP